MSEQLDFPFEAVATRAQEVIDHGGTVYFKFTCQRCGTRQTFDVPNTLYFEGSCEECGYVTNLQLHGCNYAVVFGVNP